MDTKKTIISNKHTTNNRSLLQLSEKIGMTQLMFIWVKSCHEFRTSLWKPGGILSVQIQQQKHQNDVIDITLVSDFTPSPNVPIIEFEKVNTSSKSP